MRPTLKNIMAIAASASTFASTTAIAASPPPPKQPAAVHAVQPQAPNAWVMLSALSPSTRSIVQGGAVAAAQPQPSQDYRAAGVRGELLPFLLWFGLIAVALSIAGSGGGGAAAGGSPNSPT